ncbi:LacI family DNA-binding transcriptional regulator [Thalassotalea euphylliae]|uniref:LacI family DNA-binding transcriptional regulator n=1 Tax=Thalassotalea euphylliae TaxID=1655234 RepID=UPI0036281589
MTKTKRARIQDVAEKAGVSTMTVSRVLNNDGKVSEDKTAKVMAAVRELNYRPNVSARRLASNKSFFLGLLYFDLNASYVSKFLLGALKRCRASGYHLVVDEIDENIDTSLESVKDLINITQVDGMILLPPVSDQPEVLNILNEYSVPYVRIAPDTDLQASPYVCIDDYQAAFEITQHLIEQGHTNIAHIIGNPNQGASRMRYQGYLDALRSNQISVPPSYIEQGLFTYKSGIDAAQKLLSQESEQLPSAIFAANDEMAAAVISVAHMKGLQVPKDISVVGFDDAQLATTISPHLTTIRQPIQEMAELAIELLASGKVDGAEKGKPRDCRNILDFEIIERESSAKRKG